MSGGWERVRAAAASVSGGGGGGGGVETASSPGRFAELVSSITGVGGRRKAPRTVRFHTLDVEVGEHVRLRLRGPRRREVLGAMLGETAPTGRTVTVERRTEHSLTVTWRLWGQLTVTHTTRSDKDSVDAAVVHQYDVNWHVFEGSSGALRDSFHLGAGTAHWFSGATSRDQTWPMTAPHSMAPFVCCDTRYDASGYGGVLQPVWISSQGVGIHVDPQVPLFVAINDDDEEMLRLESKYEKPYRNMFGYKLFLKYQIYHGADIRSVYDCIRQEHFETCGQMPCKDLFGEPIWSTRTYLNSTLNEENLKEFVNDIIDNGFKPSYFEISDDWTAKYGDLDFDPERFPDPKTLVGDIKVQGFKVMAWVHPFASPRSKAFFEGDNYWVRSGFVEGPTAWEHGPAKLLDVTSDEARIWFKKSLKDLQSEYNIDSFVLDYGQVNYLPPLYRTVESMDDPDGFSRKFAELAYDLCSEHRNIIVKVGVRTQKVPLLVALEDRAAEWGGLRSVIPAVFAAGLAGYPFVLPGVVGGRGGAPADEELYVRWAAAVVLMPAVLLSAPPWQHSAAASAALTKLTDTRRRYRWLLEQTAGEAAATGAPMVRPLWWSHPADHTVMTVDDQYYVGDSLMVAPVVDKGMTHRAIYLPAGKWTDETRRTTGGGASTVVMQGPRWLYSYRVRLGELPLFSRHPDLAKPPADDTPADEEQDVIQDVK